MIPFTHRFMKTYSLPILLFLFLLPVFFACNAQDEEETKPLPPYQSLIDSTEKQRTTFQKQYLAADEAGKATVVKNAQAFLLQVITEDYFNQWYGTEWDFNGTTRTPRKGKIACGYFITTVLTDAGFKIPRIKWAQQASEYYISRMTTDIKRFSNQSVATVKTYLLGRPDGLYVAGLDNHVGFVYKSGEDIQFIHASYYDPKVGVQSEELDGNNPFAKSGYRVIGRILDQEMVKKWMLGEEWKE